MPSKKKNTTGNKAGSPGRAGSTRGKKKSARPGKAAKKPGGRSRSTGSQGRAVSSRADTPSTSSSDDSSSVAQVEINRAPVLTLWAAVVAEVLGADRDEALTLGKAVAGLNAQAKGRRLGIFPPKVQPIAAAGPRGERISQGEDTFVEVCGRHVPVVNTDEGIRAVVKDKQIAPDAVQRYLSGKFRDQLDAVRASMVALAESYERGELSTQAYSLYERFRPQIPPGASGWGRKGILDLELIRSLHAV